MVSKFDESEDGLVGILDLPDVVDSVCVVCEYVGVVLIFFEIALVLLGLQSSKQEFLLLPLLHVPPKLVVLTQIIIFHVLHLHLKEVLFCNAACQVDQSLADRAAMQSFITAVQLGIGLFD